MSTGKPNVNLGNSDTKVTNPQPSNSNLFEEETGKVRKRNMSLPINENRG
jgi:hypothetical protein